MENKVFEGAGTMKPRYSAFDLSHERKLSCNMGDLVPIFLEEIIPGDIFQVNTEVMIRLAPQLAPVMHRVNVFVHYFFVPNRIIWPEWEDLITGGQDGDLAPTFPTAGLNDALAGDGTLADHLGVPNPEGDEATTTEFSQLPFRGYTKIWNEYFRDPNLQDEQNVEVPAGVEIYTLKKRCWEKDYFTSALPTSQRGPIVGIPVEFNYDPTSTVVGTTTSGNFALNVLANDTLTGVGATQLEAARIENLATDGVTVDINELRRSSAIQRWLETSMRGGYRYIETILSQFGVRSSDARLQRPEYLGGGRQPVTFSEVLNTSATATEAQGTMAGHGISVGNTNRFTKRFEEHGYVFGILSVLPRTNYQQGIKKHWLRREKFDFAWPVFANLGEQEVLDKELYWNRGLAAPPVNDGNDVFGYQQRYAEYKYGCSTVHGDFRSSLDFWHMGRIFATPPSLNATFVQSSPTNRIFAVTAGDHLWLQVYHRIGARRLLPYFANPQLS